MKKIKHLTPQQKLVLDFVVNYIEKNGYAPTLQNIANEFDKSITTAQHYLNTLEEKGYLRRSKNRTRGILPVEEASPTVMKLGYIAAGKPIEPLENPEAVLVPSEFVSKPGQYYALEVKGDSMIDDGIWDGDLIVLRHQLSAYPNETVVAVTENGATLKVLKYDENNQPYLQPRNDKYEPIYAENIEVRGKLVGIVHFEEK